MFVTTNEYEAMCDLFPAYMATYGLACAKTWARHGVWVTVPPTLLAGFRQRVEEAREAILLSVQFA